MSKVTVKPSLWDPTGVYECHDDDAIYRLVLGEKIHKRGRWDLPKGKWSFGKVDSKGALLDPSTGDWGEEWNNTVICRNFNGSFAFELICHDNGITIKDGRSLKKISTSLPSLNENP